MRKSLWANDVVLLGAQDLEDSINRLIGFVILRIDTGGSRKFHSKWFCLKFPSILNHSHEIIVSISSLERLRSIVNPIVQRNHIAVRLEYANEGNEIASLQTILVQIVWTAITRGDHHDSLIKEMRKQSLQYHRISNVRDLELVKANQPSVLDDLLGNRFSRIERIWLIISTVHLHLSLLLVVDLLVHLRHEGIEVNPSFAFDLE